MTFFTDSYVNSDRGAFFASLRAGVARWFDSLARAQSCADAFEALSALSDRQLADIGIARQDIAHHVYRDHYYI